MSLRTGKSAGKSAAASPERPGRPGQEERAATLAELCGDLERADLHLARAAQLFRAAKDRRGVCVCLLRRAWLAVRLGRDDSARQLVAKARRLPRNAHGKTSLTLIEARLSLPHDPERALALVERIARDKTIAAIPWLRVETCIVVGRACAVLERIDAAVRACRTALDILDLIPPGSVPDAGPLPYCLGQAEFYAELEGILDDLSRV